MRKTGDTKQPGSSMSYWIGSAARELREAKKVPRIKVARLADCDPSTIQRFEIEDTIPPEVDTYLAAYAEAVGIQDARDIWALALETWREHGARPTLPTIDGDRREPNRSALNTAMREAAQLLVEEPGERQDRPARRRSA